MKRCKTACGCVCKQWRPSGEALQARTCHVTEAKGARIFKSLRSVRFRAFPFRTTCQDTAQQSGLVFGCHYHINVHWTIRMTSYRTYTTTICPWIFQARPGRGSAGRGFITQWCGRIWQGNDPTGKQGSRPARSLQRASSASKGPGQGRHAAKGKGAIRKLGVLCSMRQVRRVASSVLCSMCQARRIADRVSCSMRQERHDAAALKDWDVLLCAKEICAFVCMCWKTLENR